MKQDKKTVDKARKILGLGETATIGEIKTAFRELSLKYHPDKCTDKDKKVCEKKFKEVNNANQVLIEYCLNYRISFSGEDNKETSSEKHAREHMKRFYDGWWGELKDE